MRQRPPLGSCSTRPLLHFQCSQNAAVDVVARWFALWAVNAKHDAEALTSASAIASSSKSDKRGSSSGSSAAPPITAADVELLTDAQADRIASEGEPMMTALRLAAGLVRLLSSGVTQQRAACCWTASASCLHAIAGCFREAAGLPCTADACD